jgi:hypothetical protein
VGSTSYVAVNHNDRVNDHVQVDDHDHEDRATLDEDL